MPQVSMDWGSYQQQYVHYYNNNPDIVAAQFTYEYTGAVILVASKKQGYTTLRSEVTISLILECFPHTHTMHTLPPPTPTPCTHSPLPHPHHAHTPPHTAIIGMVVYALMFVFITLSYKNFGKGLKDKGTVCVCVCVEGWRGRGGRMLNWLQCYSGQ